MSTVLILVCRIDDTLVASKGMAWKQKRDQITFIFSWSRSWTAIPLLQCSCRTQPSASKMDIHEWVTWKITRQLFQCSKNSVGHEQWLSGQHFSNSVTRRYLSTHLLELPSAKVCAIGYNSGPPTQLLRWEHNRSEVCRHSRSYPSKFAAHLWTFHALPDLVPWHFIIDLGAWLSGEVHGGVELHANYNSVRHSLCKTKQSTAFSSISAQLTRPTQYRNFGIGSPGN